MRLHTKSELLHLLCYLVEKYFKTKRIEDYSVNISKINIDKPKCSASVDPWKVSFRGRGKERLAIE